MQSDRRPNKISPKSKSDSKFTLQLERVYKTLKALCLYYRLESWVEDDWG